MTTGKQPAASQAERLQLKDLIDAATAGGPGAVFHHM